MDIINEDIFIHIISQFNYDYGNLKKISETSKYSNLVISNETNLKDIIKEKRDRYHCKMLVNNLASMIHIKFEFEFDNGLFITATEYDTNTVFINKYIKRMNKECIGYLYEFIKYYYLHRITNIYNNTYIHITIAKDLYKVILSIDKNYIIPDNNIIKWVKIKTGISGISGDTIGLDNILK